MWGLQVFWFGDGNKKNKLESALENVCNLRSLDLSSAMED